MVTAKSKRTVSLKLRQATISNLNLKPEKHGDDLQPRVDISLKFVIKDKEIDELVSAKGNPLQLLWHKDKTVMFREIKSFDIDFEAMGTLIIGVTDEFTVEFETAKLKKIVITPFIELQAEIKCQVRVDPTGHLEALEEMLIQQDCVFSFSGTEAEKDNTQQNMEV